jgi:hypothetical protein
MIGMVGFFRNACSGLGDRSSIDVGGLVGVETDDCSLDVRGVEAILGSSFLESTDAGRCSLDIGGRKALGEDARWERRLRGMSMIRGDVGELGLLIGRRTTARARRSERSMFLKL